MINQTSRRFLAKIAARRAASLPPLGVVQLHPATLREPLRAAAGSGRAQGKFTVSAVALLAGVTLLGIGHPARAAIKTWDGGGADNNWMTGPNWLDDVAPAAGDSLVFTQNLRLAATNNYAAATLFNGFSFATSAGAFTLSGNSITLGGDITDSSVNAQTSSIPLVLNANRTVGVTSRLGSLTLSGLISGGSTLTKTGAGLLTLTGGTNTFTNLTVTGGTVAAGGDGNFGSLTGTITLDGGALRTSFATLTANRNVLLGNAGGGSGTIDTQTQLTTSAIFANNGGAGGLVKTGGANLQLNGVNTYTGPTTINQGQITVDRNSVNQATLNSASTLVFSGQSTQLGALGGSIPSFFFQAQSNVSSTLTFNGLTLQPGSAQIQSRGFGTGNATLALGAITHNAGGIVSFNRTTNGTTGGVGIITTSTGNDASGILGGWAVINAAVPSVTTNTFQAPTDYATNDGTGNIVAYTGYTAQAAGVAVVAGTTNNNRVTAAGAVALTTPDAATTDINTLSLAPTATGTTTITVGTAGAASTGVLRLGANGGFLNAAGAGALVIGNVANNGTLTAGGAADTAGEINIVDATGANGNTNITINSVIANNGTGAVRLTYSDFGGASSLLLTGNNTYTGGTTINSGRVQANPNTAFGTGAVTVLNGAQVIFGLNNGTYANAFNIIGQGGVNTQDTPSALRIGGNNQTLSGTITMLGDSTIALRGTTGGVISGQITGGYSLTIADGGTPGGNLTLSNTANNYTGNLFITNERVILGNSNVLSNGAGVGNVVLAASATSILDLNGKVETINGLSTGAASFVQNGITGAPAAATLTVGDGDATATAAGIIRNNGGGTGTLAITKIGGGTQTFTGSGATAATATNSNVYTGATTITGGRLEAAGNGALGFGGTFNNNATTTTGPTVATAGTGTASIAVNNGGVLLLTGTTTAGATPTGVFDRINNTATITLGTTGAATGSVGGTIALAGANAAGSATPVLEGTAFSRNGATTTASPFATGATGSTVGLGMLALTSASTLDFGTGGRGTLVFSSFAPGGFVLNILNYSNTANNGLMISGIDGTDNRLIFNQDQSANLMNFAFNGVIGANEILLDNGFYEITAVPEPGTWAMLVGGGLLLVGLQGRRRRQLS